MIRRSKTWFSLAVLVLASSCLPASAQDSGIGAVAGSQGAFTPGAPNSPPRAIRGTVVNSVTGEPIYRALVQVGGQFAALTDHEGRFEFEGATENIIPWAMKPGYFAENNFQRYRFNTASAPEAAPIVMKLVPEAVLSGTVTGADGGPLEGINVQLKKLAVQNGLERWTGRQGTTTNSEGQYRFYELEAGKYAVATGFHTEGLQDADSTVAYVPTRYPVTAGAGAEASITLAPGDHREADLSPPVEKIYPVTGTLSGYGDNRAVGFRVQTATGEEVSPNSRFRASSGEFRLMLPGGRYQVTATAYQRGGRQRQQLEARIEITVPQGPVRGVSLALEPAASIAVDLETQTVSPPSEGAQATPPGLSMELIDADPQSAASPLFATGLPPGGESAQAAPGALRFDNVPPGRYLVSMNAQQPWYVSAASCGGVDLLQTELTIGGGAAGCSIRVVLRNDPGTVHVTLRDPDPTAQPNPPRGEGPIVYLLPVGDLARQSVLSSGWSSAYQGYQVAPGRYLVLALDHREELPYREPEAMRRYAALGQETTVVANGKADVEIAVAPGEP